MKKLKLRLSLSLVSLFTTLFAATPALAGLRCLQTIRDAQTWIELLPGSDSRKFQMKITKLQLVRSYFGLSQENQKIESLSQDMDCEITAMKSTCALAMLKIKFVKNHKDEFFTVRQGMELSGKSYKKDPQGFILGSQFQCGLTQN